MAGAGDHPPEQEQKITGNGRGDSISVIGESNNSLDSVRPIQTAWRLIQVPLELVKTNSESFGAL